MPDRTFPFEFGEYGDQAVLHLSLVAGWGDTPGALLTIDPGAWTAGSDLPDILMGKAMLRAAEEVSGLRLAYRAVPWRKVGERCARPVVFVGDNAALLAELLGGSRCRA